MNTNERLTELHRNQKDNEKKIKEKIINAIKQNETHLVIGYDILGHHSQYYYNTMLSKIENEIWKNHKILIGFGGCNNGSSCSITYPDKNNINESDLLEFIEKIKNIKFKEITHKLPIPPCNNYERVIYLVTALNFIPKNYELDTWGNITWKNEH